ncbi:hypothetical protein HGRIS_002890 [Hohenbuehelia grisea]|uniref:sphinganine-1-phosphate aldolase n=1 Tax=Hohenbuehelia grisea TaxID=104357 RepID=A0ABR3JNS3_9AGAR
MATTAVTTSSRMVTFTVSTARDILARPFSYESAKTLLFFYVVFTNFVKAKRHLRARGVSETVQELYRRILAFGIRLILRLPSKKKFVEQQMGEGKLKVEDKLVPKGPDVVRHLRLPETGQSPEWIIEEMQKMDSEIPGAPKYRQGKLSGAVYHGGEDMEKVIVDAYQRYCVSNPLHPEAFPAVRKMEAEIVAMCLRLYNNPSGAGAMTSGGTESIIMAVKTYRDWARATKGIIEPEMIVPITAHAAFDKGGAYMKVKVHSIPVDPVTRKVDLKRVRRAINPNTILLVGSAINFPDGNQDDITALGELAAKHKIGMHVDCCLGSFIMPFLEPAELSGGENGRYKLEPFDFRVRGVTSISCDTHKYGFAPKGTSVIMYRDADLRRHQYYVNPSWTGGVYASPGLAGSRPGALIAGTWAAMQYMGTSGYLKSCRDIVKCTRSIANAIRTSIPELYVLGSPPASVVAFASKHPLVNIAEVGDAMSRRGWHLNQLQNPPALHIACTRLTVPLDETFVEDLKDAVKEARLAPQGTGTMTQIYGLGTSTVVGPSMVGELAEAFLNSLYKA